nr:DUF1700 domain-containing protein [uncultured Faecalimonas sp.]
MNRIEFMTELAALLQDVPVEERTDAMQYYNDYFDAAGKENEQKVISELESPGKVAAKLKAGLNGSGDLGGEYTENGYQDCRFDSREMPVAGDYRYEQEYAGQNSAVGNMGHQTSQKNYGNEKHNRTARIILIAAILLIGAPIVIPLVIAGIATVFAVVIALLTAAAGIAFGAVAVLGSGIVTTGIGIAHMFTSVGEGFLVSGIGLLLTSGGLIVTMLIVWSLLKIVPMLFRGTVNLCRRFLQRGVRQ